MDILLPKYRMFFKSNPKVTGQVNVAKLDKSKYYHIDGTVANYNNGDEKYEIICIVKHRFCGIPKIKKYFGKVTTGRTSTLQIQLQNTPLK